jgi:hypothetical protein
MRLRSILTSTLIALFFASNVTPALADAAKPGQSMTHIKTAAGVASTLEAAGVILYVQGGATAGVIGDSLSSATSHNCIHRYHSGTCSWSSGNNCYCSRFASRFIARWFGFWNS